MTDNELKISVEDRDLISVFMYGDTGLYSRTITWNDLMPLVQKIKPLAYTVDIDSIAWRRLSGLGIFSSIESVYQAVIEFIKWYQKSN